MRLIVQPNPPANLFDSFIIANGGSFLQSIAWGKWQETNGRKVERYVVTDSDRDNDGDQDKSDPVPLDDSGTGQAAVPVVDSGAGQAYAEIVLAAQVVRHVLPAGKQYVYVPYGPVVNCKMQNERCQMAIQLLLDHIRTEFPDAVFIRLEPTQHYTISPTPYTLHPSLHIQPGSTILLDIRKDSAELLAGMHPKTRYNIKVAERHGVQIRQLETPEAQTEAAALFADTLTRRKLVSPPAAYYAQLLNSKDLTASGLGAYYNEKLIACGLFVDFGHTRTYLFGGSSREHKNVMAPYLLHWTAIQDAKQRGFTTYDFFGAEGSVSDGSGFARFKQSFGGSTIPYAGAWDIVLKPLHYRAYQLLRTLNRWFKHI